MNKNIRLFFSLLMLCPLSLARVHMHQVNDDTFLEIDPDEQVIAEVAESNNQSLILMADAGVTNIQHSDNTSIFNFDLPPHSQQLQEAGWLEYIMGWLFPAEAIEQPECFANIELELSDSQFPNQDMAVINSQSNVCQPSANGFRCLLSVTSPNLSVLLDKTDFVKQIKFSVTENSQCSLSNKGTLYFGKVIKPFFMPLEHLVRPQVIQIFYFKNGSHSLPEKSDSNEATQENHAETDEQQFEPEPYRFQAFQPEPYRPQVLQPQPYRPQIPQPQSYRPQIPQPQPYRPQVLQPPPYESMITPEMLTQGPPLSSEFSGTFIGVNIFPHHGSGVSAGIPPRFGSEQNTFSSTFFSPPDQDLSNQLRRQPSLMDLSLDSDLVPTATEPGIFMPAATAPQPTLENSMMAAQGPLSNNMVSNTEGLSTFATPASASLTTRALKDENRPKRRIKRLTHRQLRVLQSKFSESRYVDRLERSLLARQLQVSPAKIDNWFHNQRAKQKRLVSNSQPTDGNARNTFRHEYSVAPDQSGDRQEYRKRPHSDHDKDLPPRKISKSESSTVNRNMPAATVPQPPLESSIMAAQGDLSNHMVLNTGGLSMFATPASATLTPRTFKIHNWQKHHRTTFTHQQLRVLESRFAESQHWFQPEISLIADQLQLSSDIVRNWFRSRRAKQERLESASKPTNDNNQNKFKQDRL